MKILNNLIIVAIVLLSIQSLQAQRTQEIDTATFKVAGVCEMCKDRIENAALIKGVKFAEWNKDSKDLVVIYKTDKTTEEELHKAVAEYGHDTEKVVAKEENYDKLPFCCEYRDGVETH
ncbi:MAG: cation transporter [Cyclobacteriaceae bacterium]